MRMRKKGDTKYQILTSLILGIIVLTLSLYFIFNEYFTQGDLDFEKCRQSILIRANAPEAQKLGVSYASFKTNFPLKCKTQVVEVDEAEVEKLGEIIGNTLAECWALWGNGDLQSFPTPTGDYNSYCVPCARIHLSEEAKDRLNTDSGKVDIRKALDSKMTSEYSYWTYLNNSGEQFPAFNFGSTLPFEFGELFDVEEKLSFAKDRVVNRLNGAEGSLYLGESITLPKEFYSGKGDLIINYGALTLSSVSLDISERNFGHQIPYMFYFQTGQEKDPFKETSEPFIGFGKIGDVEIGNGQKFCEYWEGIPV